MHVYIYLLKLDFFLTNYRIMIYLKFPLAILSHSVKMAVINVASNQLN